MRKVEIKLYQFNELPEDVQERIIEKNRYTLVEDQSWYEPILEGFIEDMKELGHEIHPDDIYLTGFYNQGDGASFTTEHSSLDPKSLIDAVRSRVESLPAGLTKELDEGLIGFELCKNHFGRLYSHSRTVQLDLLYEGEDREIEKALVEMTDIIQDYLRDKMVKLYSDVLEHYDCLTSDEVIKEELIEREAEYLEGGGLY